MIAADGQGGRRQICGRKKITPGLSGDELMPAPVDPGRDRQEAAVRPRPPSCQGAARGRVAILSVNNVEVVYDHVILVLKGVSLAVPRGEIVALLGANGAGKSTTLKAISICCRPSAAW